MSFSNTEWIRQQYNGVVETAKAYGLETVIYDANDQPTKQVRDLEDLVVRYADVILISTYYAEAIRPAVEDINRAGLPLIMTSYPLAEGGDVACHLAADTPGPARPAGQLYAE